MTIAQPKRKTDNKFLCLVKRPQSNMRYHDPTDSLWKPLQKERWELWTVLADTLNDAFKTAKYHFYRSNDNEILMFN